MKKRLSVFLLSIFLLGCTPSPEKPADMLPEEKMTSVMIDIHLAEARVNNQVHHPDTARKVFKLLKKGILKKHGVSDSAFKHSYDFYLTNPAAMDKLYEKVIDSLSAREAKLTPQGKPLKVEPVTAI
ncbi:DUF4296 domain-containing protein [Rufibacter quisquiliarum]|uniref:DUF4296 domain-containing protein n=1 Tax=Rufibacter quisquiliarum TaxID=1549639 RepID=A0A839GD04_9BACT|nr:hypothetical protein [Rufibacter quisquiliarum]